jgi:hypothetical protein
MSATAIVMLKNEFNAAVNCADNWNEDGINWDYVDADCFHAVMTHLTGAVYTKLFDEFADFFERKYSAGIKTLEAKLALDARIDAEYKELFGELV